ncbi:MAG: rhodanese-like domain-containing protein [Myxococcota bacterium]
MHRFLVLIVAMSGCAGSSWMKAGATPDDLDRDRGLCARYARAVAEMRGREAAPAAGAAGTGVPRGSTKVYSATLRRCMEDRGWAEALESSTGEVREYTQAEVLALIEQGRAAGPLLLDVRTSGEYASGHLPGAINIPHAELPERSPEIAEFRSRGVIAYCESGRRAAIALESLREAGFREIGHLEGDMAGWRGAGLPTE